MKDSLLNQQYYPKNYRSVDIQKIVEHLVNFQPLTIVGLPRVGLARILRFLLVHPELLEKKLKLKKVLLIEIDINDLFSLKELSFWQLVLKRITDSSESKKIDNLYLSATQANDAFTFFDNTKQAIKNLCLQNYSVFFFFNRFDRALPIYSFQFFAHLQSLKDVAKTKINYLFTSNRPLEYLFSDIFKGGNLEVFSQKFFLKPASETDLLSVMKEFKRSRKIKLSSKIIETTFKYSGGHAQYALLTLQTIGKNKFNLKKIDSLLKKDLSIFEQSKEIWDFLNQDEKQLISSGEKIPDNHFLAQVGMIRENKKILNPLFEHFLKTQKNLEKQSTFELTKKEKLLLSLLTGRQEELVNREEIINFVWSENPEDVNEWTLDQLIKRVRKKIILLRLPYKIITIKNQGFKITRQFI